MSGRLDRGGAKGEEIRQPSARRVPCGAATVPEWGGLLQSDLAVALVRFKRVEYGRGHRFLRGADMATAELVDRVGRTLVDIVSASNSTDTTGDESRGAKL